MINIYEHDNTRPAETKLPLLLTTGASYALVLRALGDVNATLEQRDRVTIDSIRNHAARHFPVQNVARATYREILERRAKENGIDFFGPPASDPASAGRCSAARTVHAPLLVETEAGRPQA